MTQTNTSNDQNSTPIKDNQNSNDNPSLQPQDYTGVQYPQPLSTNGQSQLYPQQQGPYQPPFQGNVPQQPIQISTSPEVPARVETQERVILPEAKVEGEKQQEQAEKRIQEEKSKEADIQAPEKEPEQRKFESPFRVYGYQASQAVLSSGKDLKSTKVKGNTHDAKTWLFVLLSRLLRVYKGEAYST